MFRYRTVFVNRNEERLTSPDCSIRRQFWAVASIEDSARSSFASCTSPVALGQTGKTCSVSPAQRLLVMAETSTSFCALTVFAEIIVLQVLTHVDSKRSLRLEYMNKVQYCTCHRQTMDRRSCSQLPSADGGRLMRTAEAAMAPRTVAKLALKVDQLACQLFHQSHAQR